MDEPQSNLPRAVAEARRAPFDLESMSWARLRQAITTQQDFDRFAPSGTYATDPRDGTITVFNERRARRPSDYQTPDTLSTTPGGGDGCPICSGKTTPIIDIAELTEGFTFINTNLYPVVAPADRSSEASAGYGNAEGRAGAPMYQGSAPIDRGSAVANQGTVHTDGAHFLQWTSSFHDVDWPELSPLDRTTVVGRLAELEYRLLGLQCETAPSSAAGSPPGSTAGLNHGSRAGSPPGSTAGSPPGSTARSGAGGPRAGAAGSGTGAATADQPVPVVSIMKNVGRHVGGSLSHGHQQIALLNVWPKRVRDNLRFQHEQGRTFRTYLEQANPESLTVTRTDQGKLVVPYFMRRPYDLIYLPADDRPAYVHELDNAQRAGIGEALAVGMRLMRSVLLSLRREISYNVLFHTGPGAGIYLEFLPWTQENGGFEQLGISACQGEPEQAAAVLRRAL